MIFPWIQIYMKSQIFCISLLYTKKQIYTQTAVFEILDFPGLAGQQRRRHLHKVGVPQLTTWIGFSQHLKGFTHKNTGNSPGCGVVVLGGCVFFWVPKFLKKKTEPCNFPPKWCTSLHVSSKSIENSIHLHQLLIEPLSPMSKQPNIFGSCKNYFAGLPDVDAVLHITLITTNNGAMGCDLLHTWQRESNHLLWYSISIIMK